ncbi:hypothetical protein vseg_019953 [Gypsophila vaccaria]
MWSACCSSFHAVVLPPWHHRRLRCHRHHTKTLLYNNRTSSLNKLKHFSSCHHTLVVHSSLNDDDSPSSISPKQSQMRYDPAEELYGIDVDIPPRDAKSDTSEPRSWFGPNGQYIRELPCPSCRGRGYTPCVECGIERSRKDCSLCNGKGIMTCHQCSGECVIWEESIDEIPWEKARSSSPLKVKDDDEVDNLDLKLDVRKKSNRVYRSTPEVGLKISRSLKSLNAKTGLFSNRMKIIHKDPALHAQRVAAIKKTKRTDAARKQASEALKTFFSNPENRRMRSISMKGTKFFCKNCGREGHRSHYCPEDENIDKRLQCGLCGKRGHNRKTCGKPSKPKQRILQQYHCGACRKVGHNRRTCSVKTEPQSIDVLTKNGNSLDVSTSHVKVEFRSVGSITESGNSFDESTSQYHCWVCGQIGHNRRTCTVNAEAQSVDALTKIGSSLDESTSHVKAAAPSANAITKKGSSFDESTSKYRCRACGQIGHNRRTCTVKAESQSVDALSENGNASNEKSEWETRGFIENGNSVSKSSSTVRQDYRCNICKKVGHNTRTCPQKPAEPVSTPAGKTARRQPYHCRNCGLTSHNRRTCHVANARA